MARKRKSGKVKRKPSAFNKCVGREMKGTRGVKSVRKKFVEALVACGAKVRPATKKKWKIKG